MNTLAVTIPDESIHVSRHRILLSLSLLLFLGLGAFGAWIFLRALSGATLKGLLLGPICAMPAAWFAWMVAQRLLSGAGTVIGPVGLTVARPLMSKSVLVPWGDIDAITAFWSGAVGLNGIRLKSTPRLIAQFSPEEAARVLGHARVIGAGVAMTGQRSEEARRALEASSDTGSLAALFAKRRAAYGAEIVLTPIDRDRNAEDFAEYLEGFRKKYTGARA